MEMETERGERRSVRRTSHICPKCGKAISDRDVMCVAHWNMVPHELRRSYWRAFRNDLGGPTHIQAITDAIRSVKA